jgi:hypothetical protein
VNGYFKHLKMWIIAKAAKLETRAYKIEIAILSAIILLSVASIVSVQLVIKTRDRAVNRLVMGGVG